jgi:hypothetical protein
VKDSLSVTRDSSGHPLMSFEVERKSLGQNHYNEIFIYKYYNNSLLTERTEIINTDTAKKELWIYNKSSELTGYKKYTKSRMPAPPDMEWSLIYNSHGDLIEKRVYQSAKLISSLVYEMKYY